MTYWGKEPASVKEEVVSAGWRCRPGVVEAKEKLRACGSREASGDRSCLECLCPHGSPMGVVLPELLRGPEAAAATAA